MITLMSEITKTHLFSFELKYILCIEEKSRVRRVDFYLRMKTRLMETKEYIYL